MITARTGQFGRTGPEPCDQSASVATSRRPATRLLAWTMPGLDSLVEVRDPDQRWLREGVVDPERSPDIGRVDDDLAEKGVGRPR